MALAVVTFVLAILDDFVDRKDVNSEAFDKFLLPWLKSAVTAYAAVAAAILFWEKKKTTSRLDVVLTVAVGLAVTAIAAFVLIVFITALVKRLRST